MWNKLELLPKTDLPRDKVVYLHRRGTDKVPFYVGIGTTDRPYKVDRRNDDWTTVYNEHGRTVELLFTELLEWSSKAIEVALIAQYRHNYGRFREGGFITNLSDGGEGSSGCQQTEEQKLKQIAAQTGRKDTEEQKARKLAAQNRPEVVVKRNAAVKVATNTPEWKAKRRAAVIGKFGDQSSNFKGFAVGTDEEQFVILAGAKEMREMKFNPGNISSCILGNSKSHKGFTWTRQTVLRPEEFTGLTPFNEISAERLNAAKNS